MPRAKGKAFAFTMSREIEVLEQSIRHYEEVIASFERSNSQMKEIKSHRAESSLTTIDQLLDLNERTLESLNRVLDSAKAQLQRARLR